MTKEEKEKCKSILMRYIRQNRKVLVASSLKQMFEDWNVEIANSEKDGDKKMAQCIKYVLKLAKEWHKKQLHREHYYTH